MSLLTRFLEQADAHPDRTAIIDPNGVSISYRDLERRSARLATKLSRQGIGKGDRVLVVIWPGIDLYSGLAAVWRLGAVAVFPEPAAGIGGFRHAAAVTKPKALLSGRLIQSLGWVFAETRSIAIWETPNDRPFPGLDGSETLGPNDPALISFTSGTSGVPKGIMRSHGLMLAQHAALSPLIAPSGCTEIDLVAFPAFVLTCLGHGTTAAMPRWNLRRHDRVEPAAIIRQITDLGITRALLPPVVTAALAGQQLPRSLQRILTGGGPVYPDVARRFLESAPKVGLTVVYGSTEAEPISHVAMEAMDARQWENASAGGGLPVGFPIPEVRVRIVENEIVVAGRHVVDGYIDPVRNIETKTYEGDTVWHRTGDAGRLDSEGRLWLLGRLGSIAAGHFPFAVESAARLWPGVRAAALASLAGHALLFLEGDECNRGEWQLRSAGMGNFEVVAVSSLPMDRRHRSKPDITAALALYGTRH